MPRVYHATKSLPSEERFGLQSQIRRAAVSAASTIVEGCTRRTTRDYEHFITISLGSASEVRYLLGVAARLEMVSKGVHHELDESYGALVIGLQKLLTALSTMS